MTNNDVQIMIESQRKFFDLGISRLINYRIIALKKLYANIVVYKDDIIKALKADLGKGDTESYMCEIGTVLSEITYMLKHIKKFSKDKKVKTPITQFKSKSYIKATPYGQVLIVSPWNYPFLLTLSPLVDALAAGNTVIIKPSAYSPNTSKVIYEIISKTFSSNYVSCVLGGRAENQALLNGNFNYIFFTGSKEVGKHFLECASKKLIPCTLELGGKSPTIVTQDANIAIAARRIVFGKFLNCGQTCVAPDYIYCHESVKDSLISALVAEIKAQYTDAALQNADYGKIINQKHFDRIVNLIDSSKVIYGGEYDSATLKIEPTIMDKVTWQDSVMQEEIFGPILPILTYTNLEDIAVKINSIDSPLALYVFTENKSQIQFITKNIQYGGGCINDTIMHIVTSHMGFGGVGASGMGAYHGKVGFDTFTHYKSILHKSTKFDLKLRYQPYSKYFKENVHKLMK